MFSKKFKVIENREDDVIITHYLRGSRKQVKEDIEMFKNNSWKYEMFKEGMVIWTR